MRTIITFTELGLPDNLVACLGYEGIYFELWDSETNTKESVDINAIVGPLLGTNVIYDEPLYELAKKVTGITHNYRYLLLMENQIVNNSVIGYVKQWLENYPKAMRPSLTGLSRALHIERRARSLRLTQENLVRNCAV